MSIGGSEILFILLAVLLLFGSKRIPEVAKMMGKGMREFRKATDEIKKEINDETREMSSDFNKIKKDLQG
jgi:sec-independent protein translocase protein TatA